MSTIESEKIKAYILKNISNHPKDIARKIANHFSVSRMTATRYLQSLVVAGLLIKSGQTFATKYYLANSQNININLPINNSLEEHRVFNQYLSSTLKKLSANQYDILEYALTELINNAKDHSEGHKLQIETVVIKSGLLIKIIDDGIGIFHKLTRAFALHDPQEGLLTLSKGKITTDPENHTGEGIFFSSRAVDIFTIEANGIRYTKDNIENDWFYENIPKQKGTHIFLTLFANTKRLLTDIFNMYTEKETFAFDKTEILVELAQLGSERYISRSQAKRILQDLHKFSRIVLDFRNITTVGQGFVDEVFRVFQNKHPDIEISYQNANENVLFMIKRAL